MKRDAVVLLSEDLASERRTCHLMNCKAPMPVVMQASFIASTHLSGLDHEPPILRCLMRGSNICTPNTARFPSRSYKSKDDDNMTGRGSAMGGIDLNTASKGCDAIPSPRKTCIPRNDPGFTGWLRAVVQLLGSWWKAGCARRLDETVLYRDNVASAVM